MATETPDFDAADLADAILGSDKPDPPPPPATPAPHRLAAPSATSRADYMVPILIVGLVAALGMAIVLALNSEHVTEPPLCGGLYSTCCDEDLQRATNGCQPCDDDERGGYDDHGFYECNPCDDVDPGLFSDCGLECRVGAIDREARGLFDAEERFTLEQQERC